MRKYILPILLVAVILFFAFAIYQYSRDNSQPNSNQGTNLNQDNNINKNINENTKNNTENNIEETGKGENRGEGANAEVGSSGDSIPSPEDKVIQNSCVLVRPGNLPNINCLVNYIKKEGVSLKIENNLGEGIGITIDLKTCSPKIQDNIKNNEQKDFIFSCNNTDYFNQDVLITYFLQQNGTITIGGFVNGPVTL